MIDIENIENENVKKIVKKNLIGAKKKSFISFIYRTLKILKNNFIFFFEKSNRKKKIST